MSISGRAKLSTETFQQLREYIYEKTGILFGENKTYLLENRLRYRLEECGCNNYEEYLYFLKHDPSRNQEMPKLFDSVTTNETSFFRDAVQIKAFDDDVLPLVLKENEENRRKELRVWSAASSTGEEAYTIAMQMLNKGLPQKGWRTEIVGTDISQKVIASAQAAVYGANAIRNTPPECLRKYFSVNGEEYRLLPAVKRMAQFRITNLMDQNAMKRMKNFDVIFCRNVLIYFDAAAKKSVISNLYDALRPGGYLFIGYSESLHNISRSFKLRHFNRSLVYQKEK